MKQENKRFIINYLHGSGFALDYPSIYKELIEDLKNPIGLKATIPENVIKYLGLKSSDVLEWQFDTVEHRYAVIVRKKGSHKIGDVKE